jgi:MoaA/NifB/PqqE/SkfB family radical SAM enzyme
MNEFNAINSAVRTTLLGALRISFMHPSLIFLLLSALFRQKMSARRRIRSEKSGTRVPTFLIASITNRCNLACAGCFSIHQGRDATKVMSAELMEKLFQEAEQLGIPFILISGGEPLGHSDFLNIASRHPKIIFPFFTNSLLLEERTIRLLQKNRHIVPVVSLEGDKSFTDVRRGDGAYESTRKNLSALGKAGIFFGVSFTITSKNAEAVLDEAFIRGLKRQGCKLFVYVEYVPFQKDSEDLVPSREQRTAQSARLVLLKKKVPAMFISFPADEEKFGGCLASGRGFVHISAGGDVEPCPFAPYSDVNISQMGLKEALRSGFLKAVRDTPGLTDEKEGGCALWNEKEKMKALLGKS